MAQESLDHHPALTASDEADLVEYGAVCPLAIAALLLGLASWLASTYLLLLIVPLLAVLVSAAALRRIARSEGALIGRPVALAGLALALLFASLAVGGTLSRQWIAKRQAEAFAQSWLDMVRDGQLQRAHQLHLAAERRQRSDVSLARHYAESTEAQGELDAFYETSPLKEIVAAPPEARFHRRATHMIIDAKTLHFAIHYDAENAGKLKTFVLVPLREPSASGGLWRMEDVAPPAKDANP